MNKKGCKENKSLKYLIIYEDKKTMEAWVDFACIDLFPEFAALVKQCDQRWTSSNKRSQSVWFPEYGIEVQFLTPQRDEWVRMKFFPIKYTNHHSSVPIKSNWGIQWNDIKRKYLNPKCMANSKESDETVEKFVLHSMNEIGFISHSLMYEFNCWPDEVKEDIFANVQKQKASIINNDEEEAFKYDNKEYKLPYYKFEATCIKRDTNGKLWLYETKWHYYPKTDIWDNVYCHKAEINSHNDNAIGFCSLATWKRKTEYAGSLALQCLNAGQKAMMAATIVGQNGGDLLDSAGMNFACFLCVKQLKKKQKKTKTKITKKNILLFDCVVWLFVII